MDWFSAMLGAAGAVVAGAPVWGPVLYKFLKGKADAARQDRVDLISAHETFGSSMQQRVDLLRVRLDAAELEIRRLERENGECSATRAALMAELAALKEKQ